MTDLAELRSRVRSFLRQAQDDGRFEPTCDGWLSGFDPAFSAAVGDQGWIGMTWPREHHGGGASQVERFTVIEELLAHGAPVAAHWFADRQIGPALLRHGTPAQRARYLPDIVRGRRFFAIGLSEPDAGSDLASLRTRAEPLDGGWSLQGTKVWTSNAHRSHHVVVLARTPGEPGQHGRSPMTQFVVDVPSPGLTIRPIRTIGGEEHFCEVHLDDVRVPDDAVLGRVGAGWEQAMGELADERSGPERYLTTMPLLRAFLRGTDDDPIVRADVGRAAASLMAARSASFAVAESLDRGEDVAVAGALVKDVGTRLEQDLVDLVARHANRAGLADDVDRLLSTATRHGPGFTLRGGTTEILRSIVGKGLR